MTKPVNFCLETERLMIKPPTLEDLSDYQKINADQEVRQWIADGSTVNADKTKERVELWVRRVQEGNPLIAYPVRLKTDKTFVGSVHFTASETPGTAELSYMFVRIHQNKKFCSEATVAFIYERVPDLLVENTLVAGVPLQTVEATAREDNVPSNCILKKLGFVFKKTIQKQGWKQDRLYYQLDLTSEAYISRVITRVITRLLDRMCHPLNNPQAVSIISGYLAEPTADR